MKEQSTAVVLRVSGPVKFWERKGSLPSVDELRPRCCPGCEASAGPRVGRTIVGHGVVPRWLLGPVDPESLGEVRRLFVRRYRCRACRLVMRVSHASQLRFKHYGASTIALGLGLWGVVGQTAEEVRARLSPQPTWEWGTSGWRSLSRWARGAAEGRLWGSVSTGLEAGPRALAERCARQLVAAACAFEGGLPAQLWEAGVLVR